MISIPDISQTYPKEKLTLDSRFVAAPRFVSDGSAFFDGDSGKITVSAASGINGLFGTGGTLSLWMFPKSDGEGNWGRVLDATTGYMTFLGSESGSACKLYFYHDWSTDGNWVTTSTSINIGVWNHLAITYNGSSTSNNPIIYVNGKSVAVSETQAPVGSIDSDDADKVIGNTAAEDRTFDGNICNMGMWKGTVLTADQVKDVMMASSYGQVKNVEQPTAYYPLSTNGNDSTGNYNGTLA